MGRPEDRENFDDKTRLRLLEIDQDKQDDTVARMNARLSWILGTLVAAVISTATATVLLVWNLSAVRG